MSMWMYLLFIVGFLFLSPHNLSGASSSDHHEASDEHDEDDANRPNKKKGQSRKKDLPEYHPPTVCDLI